MDSHADESSSSSSIESEDDNKISKEDSGSEVLARNKSDSSDFNSDAVTEDDDCGLEFDSAAQGKLLLAMIEDKFECIYCGKLIKHMASHMKTIHGPGKPKEMVNCGFCGKVSQVVEALLKLLTIELQDILKSDFFTHVSLAHSTPSSPLSPSPPASSESDHDEVQLQIAPFPQKPEINNNENFKNPDSQPIVKLDPEVDTDDYENIEVSTEEDDKVAKIRIVPVRSRLLPAVDVTVRGDLTAPVKTLKRKYGESLGMDEDGSRKLQFFVGGEVVGEEVQIISLNGKDLLYYN